MLSLLAAALCATAQAYSFQPFSTDMDYCTRTPRNFNGVCVLANVEACNNFWALGQYCSECGRCQDPNAMELDEYDTPISDFSTLGRIVGGSEARAGQYPYFVAILWERNGEWFLRRCGASLVHDDVVLTAAHCMENRNRRYQAYVGAHSPYDNNGGALFARVVVKEIVLHPNWRVGASAAPDDIALLILETSVAEELRRAGRSGSIEPITLGNSAMYEGAGTRLTVMGMGQTSEGGSSVNVLRHVDVNIVSNPECARLYSLTSPRQTITSQMLCATGPNYSTDACGGDSGGPLVRGTTQVGIVSWGNGCARQGAPGVYARVSFYYSWIQSACRSRTRFRTGLCR